MQVLRSVQDTPQNKAVFTYNEITSYLSEYILDNQAKFFDKRNIKVAHVENDILGIAFGVKVFHRTQVTALLQKQLIRFKPLDQNNCINLKPTRPKILRFTTLPFTHNMKVGQSTSTEHQGTREPDVSSPAGLTTKPFSLKRPRRDNAPDHKNLSKQTK